MKTKSATLLMSLALAAPTGNILAQDAPDQPQPPRRPRFEQQDNDNGPREIGPRDGQRPRGPRPGGPGSDGQKPPVPPLIAALDANHDGEIDAKEIESASAALKKLDKNSDGKLTMEELRPPRPMNPPDGGDQDGRRPPGKNFRGERPDGPPPGDRQGQPRRPRPQDDQR